MAYVHRYFTKASVDAARRACSKVRGHPLRIGTCAGWTCVESDTPVLDLLLLARLTAPAGDALGLIVQTGADALALARATNGKLVGEYFLLDGKGSREGSPIGPVLDDLADSSEALKRIEADTGIPVFEPLQVVVVHRAGLDASTSGWLLVGAATLAVLTDAALHPRASVISLAAMSVALVGFLFILRFRSGFERVGMALLACIALEAIVFSVAGAVFPR